ncbi:hypothetical protein GH733_010972 [Mirounga leonina]|nr:hypothetical protein GH733_010972 [Mirounga leonina]
MDATDLDRTNQNISTQDLAIYTEAGSPEKSESASERRQSGEAQGALEAAATVPRQDTTLQRWPRKKLIEVDDEHKLRTFYEKCMATEVAADALGEEWKDYVVRISGGNDKQGFPMGQGVSTHDRVRLLLKYLIPAGYTMFRFYILTQPN